MNLDVIMFPVSTIPRTQKATKLCTAKQDSNDPTNVPSMFFVLDKGKGHPRTGLEGPEVV